MGDAEEFLELRRNAKQSVQREYGLLVDSEEHQYRLFVFLGRWVKQKGVDYIADVAERVLATHRNTQFVLIGPPGDSYGTYALIKLQTLVASDRFQGRLYVKGEFAKVKKDLKLACDFCLMPSRDEPFGFVDLEFASYGAATIGSLRGGLGKVPGFYYRVLDGDSTSHVEAVLCETITTAMRTDKGTLDAMALHARAQNQGPNFSVEAWQRKLLDVYTVVLARRRSSPQRSLLTTYRSGGDLSTASALLNDQDLEAPESTFDARSIIVPSFPALGSDLTGQNVMANAVTHVRQLNKDEFLRQEVDEGLIQRLVEAKVSISSLTQMRAESATRLLADIRWTLRPQDEKRYLTTFLSQKRCGILIIDWVICISYILGPFVSTFFLVFALPETCAGCETIVESVGPIGAMAKALAIVFWTCLASQ